MPYSTYSWCGSISISLLLNINFYILQSWYLGSAALRWFRIYSARRSPSARSVPQNSILARVSLRSTLPKNLLIKWAYFARKCYGIFQLFIYIVWFWHLFLHSHRQLRQSPFHLNLLNRIPIPIYLKLVYGVRPIKGIPLIVCANYICHNFFISVK